MPTTALTVAQLIDQATEAIRALVNLTHPAREGLTSGSDTYVLAGGLAVMVDALPQILRQASARLETQAVTGRLTVDGQACPGSIAALNAAAHFDNARTAAVTLGRLLHDAQQTLDTLHST